MELLSARGSQADGLSGEGIPVKGGLNSRMGESINMEAEEDIQQNYEDI